MHPELYMLHRMDTTMSYFCSFIARSWLNDLEDIGQGKRSLHTTHSLMLVIIFAKYRKNTPCTIFAVEWTKDVTYFSSFIAKLWLNNLEDISQGQWPLCTVHPLIHLCLIWKESIQTDGWTEWNQYPPTTSLCGSVKISTIYLTFFHTPTQRSCHKMRNVLLERFERRLKCCTSANFKTGNHISWPTNFEKYMMTSSNGNIFRVTGPLCGEFTSPDEFPTQRPVIRSFDVFFDLRLNKQLSKQPWSWWFEMPSWSLWRQCNEKSESRQSKDDSAYRGQPDIFKSLRPNDYIWCSRIWSILVELMHYWPFVRGIHQLLVDSPHKGPVLQKVFPYYDITVTILRSYPRTFHCVRIESYLHKTYNYIIYIPGKIPKGNELRQHHQFSQYLSTSCQILSNN